MRPVTLELQGFASFRERTVIDFADSDLFVLFGPTGAGKSSVIDAMVFALYGAVPRYDDRRLVAPVISQGQLEARVRLTFTVAGERFTATRVVRRTRSGATTKEARLEHLDAPEDGGGTQTVAGNADELTAAVEDLLGLSFDHFTKTVVLPQGDFQEFLHAKPKERQDLLVELLDLSLYRRVAATARERGKQAQGRATAIADRLEGDLAGATEDAVSAAKSRLGALEELQDLVDAAAGELEDIVDRGRAARRAADDARDRLERLTALTVPDDVPELSGAIRAAQEALGDAEAALATATAARERAEAARDRLPEASALRRLSDLVDQRGGAATAVAEASSAAAAAARERDRAQAAADEASRAVQEGEAALRSLQRRHLAHAVAAELSLGEPCPVCDQEVTAVPDREVPQDLAGAEQTLTALRATAQERAGAARAAEQAATRAAAAREHAQSDHARIESELRSLADELDLAPERDAIVDRRDEVAAAEADAAAARAREKQARAAAGGARATAADLQARTEAAWQAFGAARDGVASLGPPAADRTDLDLAWRSLVGWATEQRPTAERAASEAGQAIAATERDYRARIEELKAACGERGVEVAGTTAQDVSRACVDALATARSELDRLERDLQHAQDAREQLGELTRQAELAIELGRLLDARNFEPWLLNRALKRLVVGASAILRDLTTGTYSLDVGDDGGFLVVDHRNADEARPAKTLSGGETFLASLALALSLAEHVAELAAQGSARLEALFLDEGFGTLDADTLDTVAAAIEELGARGRMVGLITHVRDLAERLPIRYEVRRTATTSTVERVAS